MPDINKTFGATSRLTAEIERPNVDPDIWLESLARAIDRYIDRNTSDVYDVRFSFPGAKERAEFPKLQRTVIHFEIDDIEHPPLGVGDNYVDAIFDDAAGTTTQIAAEPHVVNFDVGIWASPNSGGVTARLRAYQHLHRLFGHAGGYKKALRETDVEIVSFTGGNFIREDIGDIPVFRVVGIELVVRVMGRRLDTYTFVDEVAQNPGLRNQENQLITG